MQYHVYVLFNLRICTKRQRCRCEIVFRFLSLMKRIVFTHINMYTCPSCWPLSAKSSSACLHSFFSKAMLAKAGEIHCGLEKLPRRRGWLSPFSFLHIDRVLRVLAFGIAAMQLYFFFGLLFLHFLCVPWNFLLVLRERLKSHKYSHVYAWVLWRRRHHTLHFLSSNKKYQLSLLKMIKYFLMRTTYVNVELTKNTGGCTH